ncbi:hypothetical protein HDIA_0417 [Hartmannibacter diazotrophicus]|uniref:Uncharacterized protein n=1 Tax=Hartmannibacter diazotrophicus TaxID=1482074 RepID=A0A2C9D1C3_9HYPH|nr:hypothetical protein HDIA_0417 [Hartmannibacter diazotrophicus]
MERIYPIVELEWKENWRPFGRQLVPEGTETRWFEDWPDHSGSSSLKVRWPEIIVETMLWRDMMSSRIAT